MDFIIVITSVGDLLFVGLDMQYLKVLRLLRTLKPLRFISHNSNIKLVVDALMESVSAILNVALVILFVWLMFGILVFFLLFPSSLFYLSTLTLFRR